MLSFKRYELCKTSDAWGYSFYSFVLWILQEIQLVFE